MDTKPVFCNNEEIRQRRFERWLAADGIEFEDSQSAQEYRARVQRVIDVIKLSKPDRVPVLPQTGVFPAFYDGITQQEAMYDYNKASAAWYRYVSEFAPDFNSGASNSGSGPLLDILDYRLYRWAGHGLPPTTSFQFVEEEYMLPSEYDDLIKDPSWFMFNKYSGRICKRLAGLQALPNQFTLIEIHPILGSMLDYANPALQDSLMILMQAGTEAHKWSKIAGECDSRLAAKGFPIFMGGGTKAPFDVVGDTLRGTAGIMKDLYRCPEKLLEALDRLTPLLIDLGISTASHSSSPIVFIPLHKGADGFMNAGQYQKFYWPTLKKLIHGLIEAGLVPQLFAEGSYLSRLDVIRDIPPGKTIWLFDRTDMLKVFEALNGKACLMGNVPSSLLATGSPSEVTEYCRFLIENVGRNGAFILSSGASVDNFKAENIRAMIDAAKIYGRYK